MNHKFKKEKKYYDWLHFCSIVAIFLLIIVLLSVLGFIIYRSVPILKEQGLGFIWSSNWQPKNNNFGIWNFVVSTFWTMIITMFFVVFANLFASVFISKFLPKKIKKVVLFFVQFFAGVPSICFGIFGAYVFVDLFQKLGVNQPQNMLTAILVLVIMILPTTIALSVNLLDSVSKKYELSAYALGVNRVTIAFLIVKKICSKAILVVLFFGFCKAIGEVTAISLIAGNGPNSPPLNEGFANFFFGSITTLSSLIGLEIAENFSDLHESSLFAVSGVLIFLVLIVNLFLTFFINLKIPKITVRGKQINFSTTIISQKITSSSWFSKIIHLKFILVYWFRLIMMVVVFMIVSSLFSWVLIDITWKGLSNFNFNYLIATTGDGGLLSVLLATLILILATIIFSTPIAFLIAVFLVYYGKQNWFMLKLNQILTFFIYQFSSSPTIIFGMFGLAVFVSFFSFGFSILSAALTMTLIVLPIMIQTIRQNFESFPQTQYYSAAALGLKKKSIILKLVVPATLIGFFLSLIFAINRIVSESSPIFITMGTTVFFPKRGIFSGGRTLSSHMYLVEMGSLSTHADSIVYQTAFITLFFLFILNIFVYYFQHRQMKKNNL